MPNSLTLAYDHGIQESNGRSFNWFGGVETSKALNTNLWKAGVEVFDTTGRWSFNNLLQFSQNDQNLVWLHKSYLTHNKWFFNRYHTVNLSAKSVTSSGWLFAFRNRGEQNNDFSARFEMNGYSNVE